MESKLVQLSEEDSQFVIKGNAIVSFRKPRGFVVMHNPIYGAIPEEAVDGLVVDKNELYLDWRRSTIKEHTFLGEVDNLEQASEFVSKVNLLYKQNAN